MQLLTYQQINRLEQTHTVAFNRQPLCLESLLAWLEALGTIPLEDRTVKTTAFLFYRNKNFVLYNPTANPLELLLSLGHEAGHLALGHFENVFFQPHVPSIWARNGLEKDAGIVGFLCWLPTPELERLLKKLNLIPKLWHRNWPRVIASGLFCLRPARQD